MGRFTLPVPTADRNVQALGRIWREDITGETGSTLTLSNSPVTGTETVFKNGALLWASTDSTTYDYTITGNSLSLTVAAVSSDKFTILAHFRV
jgi:hypothetical protein